MAVSPFDINEPLLNPGLNYYDPKTDRFTTSWRTPYDRRAEEYCIRKGIPFQPLTLDLSRYRAVNQSSDAEARAEFARDFNIGDGATLAPFYTWWKATRGQKLRRCRCTRMAIRKWMDTIQNTISMMEDGLRRFPTRRGLTDRWMDARGVLDKLGFLDGSWMEMERCLEEEAKDGWDWKEGVVEQLKVRDLQRLTYRKTWKPVLVWGLSAAELRAEEVDLGDNEAVLYELEV